MLKRSLVTFFGLLVVMQLLPGIQADSLWVALVAALVLSLINLTIKPLLLVLTLPATLLTLGLFTIVINGACLGLTAWLVPGFAVAGFGSALLGALLLSLTTILVNSMLR
jgi:putative membrane protein